MATNPEAFDFDIGSVVGPQGEIGPQGPQGPKGDKGDPGTTDAGGVSYDATETYQSGTAGYALSELNRHLSDLQPAATSADVGKALIVKTVVDGKPTSYEYGEAGGGAGLTSDIKDALLQLAAKVAYTDGNGQDYYNDLFDALYSGSTTYTVTNSLTNCSTSNPTVSVVSGNAYTATITAASGYTLDGATVSVTMGGMDISNTAYSNGVITIASVSGNISITVSAAEYSLRSISATFTQGQNVYYDFDYLNDLKEHLVVTGYYGESQPQSIPVAYCALSGTLVAGTSSTITVTYGGKTDTFTVSVTALPSLPPGYTAYDYVLNNKVGGNGTANNGICVDTGLNAQTYAGSSYSRRIDFKNNDSASSTTTSALYGCRNGTGDANIPNACVVFVQQVTSDQGDMNAYCQLNGVVVDIGFFNYNTLQVVETKGKKAYKNGVLVADNIGDPTQYTPANLDIALFGEKRDNFYAVKSSIKLYRFIVRNSNGEAVAAMLPCTDSNNSPGLYDVVREVFKQAKTPSYLTAGNE